jgi:hypothetical protein
MMATDSSPRLSARQVMRGDSDEIDFIDDAYTRALSEWNQIESFPILRIPPEQRADSCNEKIGDERSHSMTNTDSVVKGSNVQPYSELDAILQYITSLDLTTELPHIVCHSGGNMVKRAARKVLFIGPKPVKRKLKRDRNRIFALALKSFDNAEPVHQKMLVSIYQHLRPDSGPKCPRIGNHWEEIGFQGNDPASDLRGVGLLGLFQLTAFILAPQTAGLAHDVYALSTRKGGDFPFCVMGLNLTQIALHHLREGTLNREINRSRNPLVTFNHFYASLFMRLLNLWHGKNCTVADTGFVLRDLKRSSSKSVRKSILTAMSYKSRSEQENSDELIVFSDIGNIVNPDATKGDVDENLV